MTTPEFDVVLKGGHVIDPSSAINAVLDVGITGGKIAAVAPGLKASGRLVDVSGKYICPGLIDLHGHWYEGSSFGIDPNICLNHGVTTVVDAGTTGFINFPYFRRHTIDQASVGILAFIHVGCVGLPTTVVGELEDLRYARPIETARIIDDNRDIAVGVKVRIGTMTRDHALEALDLAMEASQQANTGLMVHISSEAPTSEILNRLRPGDIVTHCFQGRGSGLFRENRELLPEALEARTRGVIFDVGHGCGSFSWDVARQAFEDQFWPDTISTDLHRFCVERWAKDLPTTMSKFLHLGMSLQDVILKTTWAPAQALGRTDLGSLRTGCAADILVFSLEDGEFDFEDTHFRVEKGRKKLTPQLLFRRGNLIEPGVYPSRLRPLLQCDLEVLDFVEQTK
jgi:dihydroorotase